MIMPSNASANSNTISHGESLMKLPNVSNDDPLSLKDSIIDSELKAQ